VGNIPYFSGVNTFANVATTSATIGTGLSYSGTFGDLIGGGAGTLTADLGTSVTLTSEVDGVLPIANGGTNASSFGTSNGVVYYDGTRLVSDADLTFDGSVLTATEASIGTLTVNTTFTDNSDAVIVGNLDVTGAGNNIQVGATATTTINGNGVASIIPYASSTAFAVSGSMYVTPLTSALLLTDSTGLFAEYTGTTCTNQFVRSLDALGAATCNTVGLGGADVGGVLTANKGGTGNSSYAVGDLLYASGATALSKLAGVATGNALISGGVATAPSWGKIGLTTHISGTLPVGNGGTGLTTFGGTNTVLYTSSADTLTSSGNLTFDGSQLGIGTTSPNSILSIGGSPVITTDTSNGDDTKQLVITGAGAGAVGRGGIIKE